eukprot:TRINITY_DN3240_c0_g1_i2.p1 TRINITY_DN3240_c0_g1~~TRINITY_DN3240_c0_g1_i2.p1  ORF type:complete len:135 (+),score=14.25 TRINITY_DN3240_c0_g1_i2:280-684(+)
MRSTYNKTYDQTHDSFRVSFLVAPCAILALIFHHSWQPLELLHAFSIYLESVAILPQLFMLIRTKEVELLTLNYIFCLGAYRGLYVLNWIWRYMTEPSYTAWLVWIPGIVQTLLYADFFYEYYRSLRSGQRFLP